MLDFKSQKNDDEIPDIMKEFDRLFDEPTDKKDSKDSSDLTDSQREQDKNGLKEEVILVESIKNNPEENIQQMISDDEYKISDDENMILDETEKNDLRIDKDFELLVAPLNDDEFGTLEQSILVEGCRDAIVKWNDTIIDGHNRYKICKKHKIPFRTVSKYFSSKEEVLVWIANNQLARRNISEKTRNYLIGVKYELNKTKRGGYHPSKDDANSKGHCDPLNTAEKVGKDFNISPKTVKRASQFYNAVEKVAKNASITTNKLVYDEFDLSQSDIIRLAEMSAAIQKSAIDSLIKEEVKSFREFIKNIREEVMIKASSKREIKPIMSMKDRITWLDQAPDCDLLITNIVDETILPSEWLPLALQKIKETGSAYIIIESKPENIIAYLSLIPSINCKVKLRNILIWEYKNFVDSPNIDYQYISNYRTILHFYGSGISNMITSKTCSRKSVLHFDLPFDPLDIPIELVERLITNSTCKKEIVLDPFSYKGTVAFVANTLNRVGHEC